jgi:hypothetical protein
MVEETGEPGENHWPAASHWQTLSHNVASSTPYLSRIQTHNVSTLVMIDTDFIGSYKSNYHMMTTITAPPNHLKVWVTTWDIENRTNRTTWQSQRGLFSPPPTLKIWVSKWLPFNTKWAPTFQLYHVKNKLYLMMTALY